MNKRNLLIIIGVVIVCAVVLMCTVFFVSSSNGEVVIDNVAGVNNVTLPAENFSVAGTIPVKGFSIIHYKPLGKDIHFYDLNMSDTGYTNLINIPGVDNDTKNISGISGTLHYHPEAKTLIFIFEANNQLYSIDVMFIEQNQVGEAEQAIAVLLAAWLEVSGYKQTDNIETFTNEPNINNSNNSTEEKPMSEWDKGDYLAHGYPNDVSDDYSDYEEPEPPANHKIDNGAGSGSGSPT